MAVSSSSAMQRFRNEPHIRWRVPSGPSNCAGSMSVKVSQVPLGGITGPPESVHGPDGVDAVATPTVKRSSGPGGGVATE